MLWVPKTRWIIISAYANGALAPEYELISRIIKVRTEKEMTQKQRAEKIGTRQSNITRLECGLKREIKTIIRSCKKLKDTEDKERIADISFVLLDQALLVGGEELKDPADFVEAHEQSFEQIDPPAGSVN